MAIEAFRPINKYFTTDPAKEIETYQSKEFRWKVATIALVVGTVAIIGAVYLLATMYALPTLATTALTSFFVATPLLITGSKKFMSYAEAYKAKAIAEKSVFYELRRLRLSKPSPQEIANTLWQFGVNPSALPLQEIARQVAQAHKSEHPEHNDQELNENEALIDFLPLVARVNILISRLNTIVNVMEKPTENIELYSKEEQDLEYERKANLYEGEFLPTVLDAALLLKIMSEPFTKAQKLGDLGTPNIKSFAHRQGDRLRNEDIYFIRKDGFIINRNQLDPLINKMSSVSIPGNRTFGFDKTQASYFRKQNAVFTHRNLYALDLAVIDIKQIKRVSIQRADKKPIQRIFGYYEKSPIEPLPFSISRIVSDILNRFTTGKRDLVRTPIIIQHLRHFRHFLDSVPPTPR